MLFYIPKGPGGMEGGRVKFLMGGGVVGRVLPGQLELEPGCHMWCGWVGGEPQEDFRIAMG